MFSTFYNKLNRPLNKHAPITTLSRRRAKQNSKPWITQGIRLSIKVINNLYYSGDKDLYKIYRNKISTLSRQSKQLYYYAYFNENLRNMKNTWAGINLLINRTKKNSKPISSILSTDSNKYTNDPTKISDVLNIHFSSVSRKLASIIPPTTCHFTEYLSGNYCESFFFIPVTDLEIENEIVSISPNKAHGLYSCPTRILCFAKHILSKPLAEIMNMSVTMGQYPTKLKHAKVIPVYKCDDETDPGRNYRPISLLSNFNRIFEKVMFKRLKTFLDNDVIFHTARHS